MSLIHRIQAGNFSLAAEMFDEGRSLIFSHWLTDNRRQGSRLLAPFTSPNASRRCY